LSEKIIGRNRKASFKYHFEARFEAGIVLRGSEVKSLRQGHVGFEDSYAVIRNGEMFLRSLHIPGYDKAHGGGHDPVAERKLLLNRQEIRKLEQKVLQKGVTLVPTKVYFKDGWAKVEIALATGKRKYDKRQVIKERDQKRELDRFKKIRKGLVGR
jgi:SsrA-binding protein